MEITLQNIKELVDNKIQENTNLEYKRSEAIDKSKKKIEALSISVSSFANSNGGRLIIGIKEYDEKDKRHLPEKISPIDILRYPKEWLEQVINDNIYPRIANLNIHPIEVSDTQYIFVIDVPQSDTAHQAKDFKYYKRHIFRKLPMQDYEIRDVLNRNKNPKLECNPYFYIIETKEDNPFSLNTIGGKRLAKEPRISREVYIGLNAKNIGRKTASFCKGEFWFPSKYFEPNDQLIYEETKTLDEVEYVILKASNTKREIIDTVSAGMTTKHKYAPTVFEPIIPNSSFGLCFQKVNKEALDDDFEAYWEVLVDEAEPSLGKTYSNAIERQIKKY